MKRKNNYQMPRSVAMITLILIGLAFISMLTINQEPEFKITKEVCEKGEDIYLVKYNITTYRDAMNEFDEHYGVFINSSIREEEIKESYIPWIGFNIRLGGLWWIQYSKTGFYYDELEILSQTKTNKTSEKICEQVKVDEIVIKKFNVPSYDYCKTIGYKSLGGGSNETGYGCVKIISKQDLSIEWLNENCEVEEPVCEYIFDKTKRFEIKDEEAVHKTYEGLIWFEKQKDGSEIVFYCPSNENCFKQICEEPNKYICGEYFVEIK